MRYLKPNLFSEKAIYPLLLFIITVGTYYNALIYVDFINLEDMDLMNRLLNASSLNIKDLFLSINTINYYRPVIELSYRLDQLIWLGIPFGFHLTSIVLHTLNAYLVYILFLLLFDKVTRDNKIPAFVASSFFAVNPLLTESIVWVSGRSDIIAANFMLLSLVCYLLYKREVDDGYSRRSIRHFAYLAASGFFYLLSAFTKEVALSIPIIVIMFEFLYMKHFRFRYNIRASIAVSIYFICITALYFKIFRGGGVDTSTANVTVSATGLSVSTPFDHIRTFLASYGFYVKKLFLPNPLSFAIHRIDINLYAILGFIVSLVFLIWGLLRTNIFSFFAAWVLATISPAVIAAVLMLPWTPWAERYLYVPLIGFSMAAGYGFALFKERKRTAAIVLSAAILALMWASTQHRIYIWADEERLWEDTASKTDFGPVYYFYGKILQQKGKEAKAIEQYEKAIAKKFTYFSYMALANIKLNNTDVKGLEEIFNKAMRDHPKNKELYKLMAESYLQIASNESKNKDIYMSKAADSFEKYLDSTGGNFMMHFRLSGIYRSLGRKKEAIPHLKKVIELAPPDSRYAGTARKLLADMGNN